MKANELRIGNLVLANHGTDLVSKVIWIQNDSVDVKFERQPDLSDGLITHPSNIFGIPLSEEWLLKFGFVLLSDGIRKEYFHDKWKRYIEKEKSECYYTYDSGRTKIEYVHQLQNLYFALTGEELAVSPCSA